MISSIMRTPITKDLDVMKIIAAEMTSKIKKMTIRVVLTSVQKSL